MAQTAITFTKNAQGNWEYSFTSAGAVVVQLNTASAGRVFVFATFGTNEPSRVGELDNPYASCMFGIDLPVGAEVTITSTKQVTKATMDNA